MKTLYIEPGSPWENGCCCERFNGSLRNELLDGEIFRTPRQAQVLIEGWRRHCNTLRPHSSLGYRAPEAIARPAPWRPAWWAISGVATIPTTDLDPPHRAAPATVPALGGSGFANSPRQGSGRTAARYA